VSQAGPVSGGRAGARFDPLDPRFLADPDTVLAQARREEPVFYSPVSRRWIVTRYDDVVAVLKDNARFSARGTIAMPAEQLPAARAALAGRAYPFEVPALVNNDPPDHTRIRAVTRRPFTQQRVAALAPRIEALADQLLDRIEPHGHADLVGEFAQPLTLGTLAALTGLSEPEAADVRRWSDLAMEAAQPGVSPGRRARCVRGVMDWQEFCSALIRLRRHHQGGDVVSALASPAPDGQVLDTGQAAAVLIQLQLAGFHTTSHGLASIVDLLLRTSGQWAALAGDPARAGAVTEEGLRIASPLMIATRTVTRTCELGGAALPAGARLRLMLGSANRDENSFGPGATRFDPDRPAQPMHVAFGIGIHHCIGAALARLEIRIALERLAARLPGLHPDTGRRRYRPDVVFRGLESLPVRWQPRLPAATPRPASYFLKQRMSDVL
jgi:cytochrome P450